MIHVDIHNCISWAGGPGRLTVLELHRMLQDMADDAEAVGGDLVDITSSTPSVRHTDHIIEIPAPFTVDPGLIKHLCHGTLITPTGTYTDMVELLFRGTMTEEPTGTRAMLARLTSAPASD
jgi:hypothetical protein